MDTPTIYCLEESGNDAFFTPKDGAPLRTWAFCFLIGKEYLDRPKFSVIEVVHCTLPKYLDFRPHNQAAHEIAAIPKKIAGVNNCYFDQTFFPAFVRNLQMNARFVEKTMGLLNYRKDHNIIRFTRT